MSKLKLLFRGPIKTRSGYGAHARDILESLRKMDLFDIEIDSCIWGITPMTALDDNNEFHQWIKSKIVKTINYVPDVYVSVTISNEFKRVGRFNVGITAGVETNFIGRDLIDGCNQMDLILVPSNFTKDVYENTTYNEIDKRTNKILKTIKLEKPIKVLFEGVDTKIYNNTKTDLFNLNISEEFGFLCVGHWLKGDIGQDRKDIGMLIKCFAAAFKNQIDKPALILKTAMGSYSVKDREKLIKKIKTVLGDEMGQVPIYLLYGDLSDDEMNSLYNHDKIKAMVSLTKGEGWGRPLLEFSMTGKPIIATNWSGHKDFLTLEESILLGGELTEVHSSAVDKFILEGSKWFTANYNEAATAMVLIKEKYDEYKEKAEKLRLINQENFSLDMMTEEFKEILLPHIKTPKRVEMNLPKLIKIEE